MRRRVLLLTLALVAASVAACERVEPPAPAPPTEFLVAAGDSVFWIRSEADGIRVRGAPMVVALVGGRLSELYVTDEDHSFYDAVYVGQRLFRRDLINGDSTQLFADTLMRILARNYAAANPDEQPLAEEEVGSEDPRIVGSAEILVVDVLGPWASYEYRTDVDIIGRPSSHGLRRGVLDLRTGVPSTLESLFGRAAARAAIADGQRQWRELRDSTLVAAAGSKDEKALRSEYERYGFDPRSFGLEVEEQRPLLRFSLALSGSLNPLPALQLGPVAIDEPAWWPTVRDDYAALGEGGERVWRRGGYSIVARPAAGTKPRVAFALRDAGGQEWPLGFVPAPVQRLMWLDDTLIVPGTRDALIRAFDEAALYGEETRVARRTRQAPGTHLVPVRRSEPTVAPARRHKKTRPRS